MEWERFYNIRKNGKIKAQKLEFGNRKEFNILVMIIDRSSVRLMATKKQ